MYEMNPYKVLGVRNNAPGIECKKEFRRLCKLYHTDNESGGNRKEFDKVQEAWKLISSGYMVAEKKRITHKKLFQYEVISE